MKVEVGFRGSALESLLSESVVGRDDPFGANILQSIDGVAIVEVPGPVRIRTSEHAKPIAALKAKRLAVDFSSVDLNTTGRL